MLPSTVITAVHRDRKALFFASSSEREGQSSSVVVSRRQRVSRPRERVSRNVERCYNGEILKNIQKCCFVVTFVRIARLITKAFQRCSRWFLPSELARLPARRRLSAATKSSSEEKQGRFRRRRLVCKRPSSRKSRRRRRRLNHHRLPMIHKETT